ADCATTHCVFPSMLRLPPSGPLFPYTTLFRSRVSITLVSAQPGARSPQEAPAMVSILGLQVAHTSVGTLSTLLGVLILLVLVLAGSLAYMVWRGGWPLQGLSRLAPARSEPTVGPAAHEGKE